MDPLTLFNMCNNTQKKTYLVNTINVSGNMNMDICVPNKNNISCFTGNTGNNGQLCDVQYGCGCQCHSCSNNGTNGIVGPTGPMGPPGSDGNSSSTGGYGYTGPTGAMGPPGPAGSSSSTGGYSYTGPTGPMGQIGPMGPMGPPGPAGTISGSGGTGSSGIYSNDLWLLSNILGKPPTISINQPVITSTNIYISWNYPVQFLPGFSNTVWFPNITSCSLKFTSENNFEKMIVDSNSNEFIRNNSNLNQKYVTALVLYKNNISPYYSTITYQDSSNNQINVYAYNYYDVNINSNLNSNPTNSLSIWYSNYSTFNSINSSNVSFAGYLMSGYPSLVLNIDGSITTSSTIIISYTKPTYADTTNTNEGSISSYNIKYVSTSNTIRYGGHFVDTEKIRSSTQNNYTTTGVYPDTTYNVFVSAVNNSGNEGPYNTLPIVSTTKNIIPMNPISSIAFSLNESQKYSNGTIYYFNSSGVGTSIGATPLIKNIPITANIIIPIHSVNNRGNFGTSSNEMTLKVQLNANGEAVLSYPGFGTHSLPTDLSYNNVVISTLSINDNETSTEKMGYYLNANVAITALNSGFIPKNTTNTLTVSQTLSGSSGSANYNFYYDVPLTNNPTCNIDSVTLSTNSSFGTYISGVYILFGNPSLQIKTTTTNMGNYFYSSPLVLYSFSVGPSQTTSSETDLTNASGHSNGQITNNTLIFNKSITLNSVSSIYSKTIVSNATSNNILSSSVQNSFTTNAIIDGPSYSLVYTQLSQSIQTINSGGQEVSGCRIWSAPSINNNCPELDNNGQKYSNILYNNGWNLASTNNNGYDATSEIQVCNGFFSTISSISTEGSGYLNYSTYFNNSFNYNTITSSGVRYVSMSWKLKDSLFSYSSLSFYIYNISPTPTLSTGSNLLMVNGEILPIYYMFNDVSNSSFSSTTFNSVWINGNSNVNLASSSTFYNTANKYGYYGGSAGGGVTLNGNTAKINVFIPAINPVNSTTYLHLRIPMVMSSNLRFGKITATIN
jgi:hypothetical protein